MTDNEMLDALKTLFTPINNKLEEMNLKMEELELRTDTARLETKVQLHNLEKQMQEIKKDIRILNDKTDTIITVLEVKDILPKAK